MPDVNTMERCTGDTIGPASERKDPGEQPEADLATKNAVQPAQEPPKSSTPDSKGNDTDSTKQKTIVPCAKPAAKKAAAKPPAVKTENADNTHHGQAARAKDQGPQKTEPHTPLSTAEQLQRAKSDNFNRATSSTQLTPSACPPIQEDEDDLPSPSQPDEAQDDDDDEEEPEEEEEEENDEEPEEAKTNDDEKKENGKEKTDAEDQKPADTVEKGKKKKEKTPAEKAAHARYMRFSRSLRSSLVCKACMYVI